MNGSFTADQKFKAIHKWKWRNPYLVAVLTFIHPLGMLLTSVPAFVVYFLAWFFVWFFWPDRPFGIGFFIAAIFAVYAFMNTRWKNAAIEKWKYGLPGTGVQNPRDMKPISDNRG